MSRCTALLLLLACSIAVQVGFADAKPVRSAAVVSEFKRHNPCPATGERRGACPGYEIDHVVPFCAQGADHVENLQWLSKADHRIKTRRDVRLCRAARNSAG